MTKRLNFIDKIYYFHRLYVIVRSAIKTDQKRIHTKRVSGDDDEPRNWRKCRNDEEESLRRKSKWMRARSKQNLKKKAENFVCVETKWCGKSTQTSTARKIRCVRVFFVSFSVFVFVFVWICVDSGRINECVGCGSNGTRRLSVESRQSTESTEETTKRNGENRFELSENSFGFLFVSFVNRVGSVVSAKSHSVRSLLSLSAD